MRGQIEIAKDDFDKMSEDRSSLIIKTKIGRFMNMNPPDRHHIRPFAKRETNTAYQFMFDSEIAYKVKQMERTGKIVGWKRNHEKEGWVFLI